jgi:DNA-binding transcriptional MocR family regulator
MVRLPSDVVRALRRRAATADITIAEAARQLMLPKEVKHQLGLLEHVEWLRARLAKRRDDLVDVFEEGKADAAAVDKAIVALASLLKEWPADEGGYDYAALHGIIYP